ncbi:hypothetical protein DPMN_156578 [Dreissena polymorpha]|uniref:Uncharacterized protein n=1 Tax=Dreissena polymorpha TaxID=45954 RepID=A0A9D4JCH6_DREPO|nr:hypothetical protein DPMN_156578 [Dreissena polymorpha]
MPPCGNVFQKTGTIFELIQDIIKTNVQNKFHEDWTINVTFRMLTSFYYNIWTNLLTKFHEDPTINVASRVVLTMKNAPPRGDHVFQPTEIIFKLVQDIIGTHLLIKLHDDLTINVASRVLTRFYYSHIRKNVPPPGSHVFQPTGTIFDLIQDFIGTKLLGKKNANIFKPIETIFELVQDIIEHVFQPTGTNFELLTNCLTKFHDDRTINVASSV